MTGNRKSWRLISFASLSDAQAGARIDEVDGFQARNEALLCAARTLAGGDRLLRPGSVVKVVSPDGEDTVLMRVELDAPALDIPVLAGPG